MPVSIAGNVIEMAVCPGCCDEECPRFSCSCCGGTGTGTADEQMPQLFEAEFDAPFSWTQGVCTGSSALTGTLAYFGGSGSPGSPCTLRGDFSIPGGGYGDQMIADLRSADADDNPCVWTIYALPTALGCGSGVAPLYLTVEGFDCCLETQTCALTPTTIPTGWNTFPTSVTLTSCGCGGGMMAAGASPLRRIALPAVPPCQHEGRPAAPPEGRSVKRRYYQCEAGHGVVCKCDCSPAKCKDYAADV